MSEDPKVSAYAELKEFILESHLNSLGTALQRETFMSEASLPDKLIDRINREGAPRVFANDLVNKAAEFGKLDDGRYALLAVLDWFRKNKGVDYRRKLDDLETLIIEANKDKEQFYVTIIVDCDLSEYLPFEYDVRRSFQDIVKEINDRNRTRYYKGKIPYPYFSLRPWLHYGCNDLKNFADIIDHFYEANFLGILIDSSVFEIADEFCLDNLKQIIRIAGRRHEKIGITCIKNYHVKSVTIPHEIEIYDESTRGGFGDVEGLASWLWRKYHEKRSKIEVAHAVVSGAGSQG